MIEFKYPEELIYISYYVEKLNDELMCQILLKKEVDSLEEAKHLSEFFWSMVYSSIEDEKNGVDLPWDEGVEFWNEKLLISISGYLESCGFEKQWEEVVDRQ